MAERDGEETPLPVPVHGVAIAGLPSNARYLPMPHAEAFPRADAVPCVTGESSESEGAPWPRPGPALPHFPSAMLQALPASLAGGGRGGSLALAAGRRPRAGVCRGLSGGEDQDSRQMRALRWVRARIAAQQQHRASAAAPRTQATEVPWPPAARRQIDKVRARTRPGCPLLPHQRTLRRHINRRGAGDISPPPLACH